MDARRAISIAALGDDAKARRIAEVVDRGENRPHVVLADLYLALGDTAKATEHAIVGYTFAWGDGPPYAHHWDLEDCRRVLAAVGATEPNLPPFEPASLKPFPFEADLEKLIAKKKAELAAENVSKAVRVAEKAAKAAAKVAADAMPTAPADPPPSTFVRLFNIPPLPLEPPGEG